MKFANDNDLIYVGESSALADINIKEAVENLMESNLTSLTHRNTWSLRISPEQKGTR